MKIINRAQFLAMPTGVVYQEFWPNNAGPIEIKHETSGNDWFRATIDGASAVEHTGSMDLADRLDEMKDKGASYAVDLRCLMRDGLFTEDQLFLVWERADVESLIERLQETLK